MKKLIAFSLVFFSVTLIVYILIAAKGFFIPFMIALVIAYLVITMAATFQKMTFFKKQIPPSIAYLLTFFILILGIYVVMTIITTNVATLVATAPIYQERLTNLIEDIYQQFGIETPNFSQYFEDFDLVTVITSFAGMLTDIAGSFGLIVLYFIFILIEYAYFDDKLRELFRVELGHEKAVGLIKKIASQIQSYFIIKIVWSLVSSIASYIVLASVGVDFAGFWCLMIFLFSFIPTIGAIISTIFPCLMTLIQFESLIPFIIVTVLLTSIQFVFGNIVEPKVMGKSFNLSGLFIVISLTIWGRIWGVIGMFLCIPILVVASIILSNFKQTRSIAILLSQDGKID